MVYPHRPLRRLIALALSGLSAAAFAAAPRVPLEDFVHDGDVTNMQLSPDGKYVSFLHDLEGHPTICTKPVDSKNVLQFDMGYATLFAPRAPKEVVSYGWIGDNRLIATTAAWNSLYGILAANRDATEISPISGLELAQHTGSIVLNLNLEGLLWAWQVIHEFHDDDSSILMVDQHTYSGESQLYPDVVRVNSVTGGAVTVVKNPGNVVGWGTDHRGQVRIGHTDSIGSKPGLIYRHDEDSPWGVLSVPPELRSPKVVAFDGDNRHVFMSALSPDRRSALYRLDPEDGLKGDLVLSDPEYDVIQEEPRLTPYIDGIRLVRPVFSEASGNLLGICYLRDGPRVKWFDPTFLAYQGAVDHAMPGTVNLYAGHSRDEKRVLYFCFSDRDPGTYVLLDAVQKSIHVVAKRIPQIVPAQMAQMYPLAYTARDGLTIHSYLTVPVGYPAKNLPLIVLPHGGPAVRDVWGFDPLVQFLANRGYAVLQMNYRGSPGYGQAFYRKGLKQVGGAIQDDIEDATKWAVLHGVADPKRIAIVGGSYGGYSVLFALGHNPGLYKCGISIAGVTDWMKIYKNFDDDEYKFAKRYWNDHIGNPETDEAILRRISPVNFADKIMDPLLIVQGTEDHTVPQGQAHEMISALEAAGRKPESLFISDDGHGMTSADARRKGFTAIEDFLARNLGPGMPPQG
jgi:dipeptidyl aminopeptidase/acylaminoacyl peptidase